MDNKDNLLNIIAVTGFLSGDVKLTYDETKGTYVAKFYIKNPCKIGNYTYFNDYYVVVYGNKAEQCKNTLSDGKKCSVIGKSSTWSKKSNKGNAQPGVTIIASEVHFESES